ncbi:glycoside hydrolase family 15 protein [Nocardioides sp.]|uniref:glycoside hydrolase family 15 protein n=1 Tax=Nocardioides sp. TaxID=35761 RepID=UPI00271887D3|nr:glycoside hydrolase family 15 protein [Nocardioides sp.]MDO9457608.1 glycoside hydrolase family 15 protein [Nocardioides sp.]
MSDWPPIAAHGLIGDLRTCALVGTDGTIDWFCAGRFDSASVFGSILDPDAGSWTMAAVDGVTTTQQFYLPESNVLVTRLLTEEGVAEVQDFMPVLKADDADHRQRLVRRVVGVRGSIRLQTCLAARPDYGRATPELEETEDGLLIAGDGVRLALTATVDLALDGSDVQAEFEVGTGDAVTFVLEVLDPDDDESRPESGAHDPDELLARTSAYWQTWLRQSTYTGRWREMVNRSALTLKLLTHEPTGAVIAAPTTSLPEEIGGSRNWDYRYVWIRDAAFTLYALLKLGFTAEAARFMEWLSQRMGESTHDEADVGPLRVAYDIDGNVPDETELDHLRGYRDSTPVRVGNAATGQLQLDIYGELIDSVYLFNKYGPGISHDAWTDLCKILDWVMANWERDDAGMWEIRDDHRAHTTSRLMCWVAVERMMRTARQRGLPGDVAAWSKVRDAIYTRIQEHSWDEEVGAYMLSEGSDSLDAGVLLMPMVKFLAPNDPRFVSTLKVIEERLVSDSLVFRYDVGASPDGVDGKEATFSLCSFWYVEALTRVGRLDEARLALEKMFTYANHLGLFAEQVGLTGEQLGNFPQAFTHLSLISAATNLDGELG